MAGNESRIASRRHATGVDGRGTCWRSRGIFQSEYGAWRWHPWSHLRDPPLALCAPQMRNARRGFEKQPLAAAAGGSRLSGRTKGAQREGRCFDSSTRKARAE